MRNSGSVATRWRPEGKMAKLTKTEIDKAQPGDARYTLWDDEVRGFGVRVFPSGQKSFVV